MFSHPTLKNDWDLLELLKELISSKCGMNTGCGAGVRDVYAIWSSSYDIWGIDVVDEDIKLAIELHPRIADKVSVADLRNTLVFRDRSFNFAICNTVIQYIPPDVAKGTIFSLSLSGYSSGVVSGN